MDTIDTTAPAYDPAAAELPWWRRAFAQGAGYMLPSVAFLAIPVFFAVPGGPALVAVTVACTVIIAVFYLGSSLVMHWPEWARWLWLIGLIASISLLAAVSDRPSLVAYFSPFITMVAAVLLPWRMSRAVIIVASLGALGLALLDGDTFAVVIAVMAFALAFSVGTGIEQGRMREALNRAEERTAVLAVAAERERIGRDLHDILGHSLTAIAIKADLVGRLIGRDDEAARAEVGTLGDVARQALADVRATASGMREVRLAAEIAAARSVLEASGVECRTPSALPVLDDAHSELFGYVVREAVTNVVRHAGASVCTIAADEGWVSVTDDGGGIPAGARRTGLHGLAERVEACGGTLEVETSASGTTVRAVLPPAPAPGRAGERAGEPAGVRARPRVAAPHGATNGPTDEGEHA